MIKGEEMSIDREWALIEGQGTGIDKGDRGWELIKGQGMGIDKGARDGH